MYSVNNTSDSEQYSSYSIVRVLRHFVHNNSSAIKRDECSEHVEHINLAFITFQAAKERAHDLQNLTLCYSHVHNDANDAWH